MNTSYKRKGSNSAGGDASATIALASPEERMTIPQEVPPPRSQYLLTIRAASWTVSSDGTPRNNAVGPATDSSGIRI
jgi:hypothetical protein